MSGNRDADHRDRRTALVTGANSGIGQAIVGALLDRGLTVVGTVRSDDAEAAVEAAHRDRAVPQALAVERLDLTDADAAHRVIDRHRPDIVVNNAGHARLGGIMDVDDEEVAAQLDALVVGPARLTRLAVERMRAEGRSCRIVNISSMLASADLPFTGWYSAAKSAFDVVGDALALELRPSDVDVVRIECGAVRTGAWDDAGDDVLEGDDPTTRRARHRWVDLTTLARPLFASPAEVGEVVARAATDQRPKAVYRVGFASRLGIVSDLVPAPVERAVTARLFGLRKPGRRSG
jgi:NAD(P)-dependent dehydrogenase (short-subunit alcohol dehydrogenase family)